MPSVNQGAREVYGTVDVGSSPLPTGAATAAKQDTGNTSVASIDGKVIACNTGAVVISSGTVTVLATNLDVRDLTSVSDSVAAVQSGAWSVTATQGVAGSTDWRIDQRRGLTPAFATIDVAASGDNTIVAADPTRKIKALSYLMVADAAVAARWKSGALTNLSGAMSFAANGGAAAAPVSPAGGHWLETAVNQALVLNLSAAIGVRGHLSYILEA